MGYGLSAATLTYSKGLIPNKVNAKVGSAIAFSNIQPTGGGTNMGTEINGSIAYNFGPFMSLELHEQTRCLSYNICNGINKNSQSHL